MDLANLGTSQESKSLVLLHPKTDLPLKIGDAPKEGEKDTRKSFTIDLLSADTNSYKSEFSKLMKIAREAKGEQTAREAEEKACAMLAKITTGCNMIFNGKPFKFSTDAMKDLYFDPKYTWIREQVEKFIRDRSNFIES